LIQNGFQCIKQTSVTNLSGTPLKKAVSLYFFTFAFFFAFFLEAQATPKLLDKEKSVPLFASVLRKEYRVLELLLKYGADPNAEMI